MEQAKLQAGKEDSEYRAGKANNDVQLSDFLKYFDFDNIAPNLTCQDLKLQAPTS
jgi:hypothetical protein